MSDFFQLAVALEDMAWWVDPLPKSRKRRGRPRLIRPNKYPISQEYKNKLATVRAERVQEFSKLYKSGQTLKQIGAEHGISRERVRQLLKRAGVKKDEGGQALVTFLKRLQGINSYKDKLQNKELWARKLFGCSLDEYRSLGDWKDGRTPAGVYFTHRRNAERRKIEHQLSLPQWWAIWESSGKWSERGWFGCRGLKDKYVMARYGDSGPYSVENVRIISWSENSKESREMDKILHRPKYASGGPKLLTHCKRGHQLSGENLYVSPKLKQRSCRTCRSMLRAAQ